MLRDQASVLAPILPRGTCAAPGPCQALLALSSAGSTHQSRTVLESSWPSRCSGSGSSGFPWIFPPITNILFFSWWACRTMSSTTTLGQPIMFSSLRSRGDMTWRRGLGRVLSRVLGWEHRLSRCKGQCAAALVCTASPLAAHPSPVSAQPQLQQPQMGFADVFSHQHNQESPHPVAGF